MAAAILILLVVVNSAITGWLVARVRTMRKVQVMQSELLRDYAHEQHKILHESVMREVAED